MRQCKVKGDVTAEIDGEMPLETPNQWKPLLLLIPLRLGLSEINPVYINGLKVIRVCVCMRVWRLRCKRYVCAYVCIVCIGCQTTNYNVRAHK